MTKITFDDPELAKLWKRHDTSAAARVVKANREFARRNPKLARRAFLRTKRAV